MIVGSIGAIGSGVMMPISNVLFGDIMDELNGDPGTFDDLKRLLTLPSKSVFTLYSNISKRNQPTVYFILCCWWH